MGVMPPRSDDDDNDDEEKEDEYEARRLLPFRVEERKVDGVAEYDPLFPFPLPADPDVAVFIFDLRFAAAAAAAAAERPVETLRCALRQSRSTEIDW